MREKNVFKISDNTLQFMFVFGQYLICIFIFCINYIKKKIVLYLLFNNMCYILL